MEKENQLASHTGQVRDYIKVCCPKNLFSFFSSNSLFFRFFLFCLFDLSSCLVVCMSLFYYSFFFLRSFSIFFFFIHLLSFIFLNFDSLLAFSLLCFVIATCQHSAPLIIVGLLDSSPFTTIGLPLPALLVFPFFLMSFASLFLSLTNYLCMTIYI